jgi:mannose-6-phosphate isomerase-like protein (cupin superfamily)
MYAEGLDETTAVDVDGKRMVSYGWVIVRGENYMRSMGKWVAIVLMSGASFGWSQAVTPGATTQAQIGVVDLLTPKDVVAQGAEQLERAKASASGSSGATLAKYPGHYTMITARAKSGGAEVHANFSDFLIVVDGEGTELTGGTVVDPKEGENGEIRGVCLEGATAHSLQKGDILHITAGTPHQAIEAPGQTITIFVIKVQKPAVEGSVAAK